MDFVKAITTVYTGALTMHGRSGRREFWWYALLLFVSIPPLLATAAHLPEVAAVSPLLLAGMLAPLPSATVRRLHDVGRGGQSALIALVPISGLIALVVLLLRAGDEGPNRFGDDIRYGFVTPIA